MRKFISILALSVLLLSSCLSEILEDKKEASGSSDIVLSLSSKAQTKGGKADGDKMSNLHIWLVYGTEVRGYLSQADADLSIAADSTTATASFKNVDRGACTLYIVANLPEGSTLASGETLPEAYPVGSNIGEDFLKYVLPEVVEKLPPYDAANSAIGMPLSTSVSLSVGAGTNRVSAEVVRCCAKITLKIRNNTLENTIILKDLAFSNCNPNKGYLFQQSDYSIPGDTDFGPFKDFSLTKEVPTEKHIVHGGEVIYLQQYMYENINAGADTLGFYISGALFPDTVRSAEVKDVLTGSGGTRTVYSLGSSIPVTSIPTATPCLIKSRAYNYYLYDDNGTLTAGVPDLSDIDLTYLWKFSSSSSTTSIQNLGTSKYIPISSSNTSPIIMSNTAISFNINNVSPYFGFYISSGWFIYTIYNLQVVDSGTKVQLYPNQSFGSPTPSSDNSCHFQIYIPEESEDTLPSTTEEKLVATDGSAAEVYFDKTISSLNYINKYGTPVPLEQIYRNQDVQIVVNIHYNPNSGVLYFETSDWVEENDNNTTFD